LSRSNNRRLRLDWSRPGTEAGRGVGLEAHAAVPREIHVDAATLPAATGAIREVLLKSGTPEVKGAETPKEAAIFLLQLAAQVEHALMVQYLYAAASVFGSVDGNENPWNKIMSVAVQEMGHLVSVQNLLLAIGGPAAFHFGRDTIRATSKHNPLPMTLEPVSEATLARFVVAEMPAEINDVALKVRVDKLIELSGLRPHRVGAIYAKLFWLFQPDDNPMPPLNLSPAPELGLHAGMHLKPSDFVAPAIIEEYEALRHDWLRGSVEGFILDRVTDSASALNLISDISEQGEGLGEAKDSHFFEFLELLDALKAQNVTVVPLPDTPVARLAPAPDAIKTTPLTTPYAKVWAELFELRYSLLLLDLWHAISIPNSSPVRRNLIDLAYGNMKFLGDITRHLLGQRENAPDAAPPYSLWHDDLPPTDALRWQRHLQALLAQAQITEAIRRSPEFQDCSTTECEILDFDGNLLLENLEQSDIARRSLIPPHPGT